MCLRGRKAGGREKKCVGVGVCVCVGGEGGKREKVCGCRCMCVCGGGGGEVGVGIEHSVMASLYRSVPQIRRPPPPPLAHKPPCIFSAKSC